MTKPKSLVIVVGAGASAEAGLPIGVKLKAEIASVLNFKFGHGLDATSGDNYIMQAFGIIAKKQEGDNNKNLFEYIEASLMIRDAMPQAASIDNFIDAHRSNEKIAVCGKLAIARCILEAESNSKLYVNNNNINNKIDFKALEPTWYNLFFRLIVENCELKDIPERLSRIAIITFNYDRCIEHYLHASLRNYYGVDIQAATELIAKLSIFHPYGFLGPLSWDPRPCPCAFGMVPDTYKLIEIAKGLKTFTEGTDETNSDIVAIRSTLQMAERVAFLGFAFNPQNLDLLYGSNNQKSEVRESPVYATALGLSLSNSIVIAKELSKIAGYPKDYINIDQISCAKLLEEYSRSLRIC